MAQAKVSSEVLTRSQRIWQRVRDARDEATISLWRARLLTESWKETEGLPQQIRRAKAFEKIVTGIPLYIDDEQLLVGDYAAATEAAELHPDITVTWCRRELAAERLPYGLDDKELEEFKDIVKYWTGRSVRDSFINYIGEEERAKVEEMCDEGAWIFTVFAELDSDKGWYSQDYEKAIKKGYLGILAEVEDELKATIVVDHESREKVHLLKAIIIELKASIEYSKRYAALAKEMAKKAKGERKAELEKIAEMCEWIPANPARNFYEALQMMWYTHLLGWFDTGSQARSPGRVDQYLYPYYHKDFDNGKFTKEEAIELLACLRCKMHYRDFKNVYSRTASTGEAQFHNCTLGGQTPDGKDAVNELSYLWLEAAFRVRSPHPTLSIRWHENLNQDFAMRAVELTRLGMGLPAWFGDKTTIQYLTGKRMGATLEEARDFQPSGCVISTIPHKTAATIPVYLNMGKIFELALYNGFDPTTGKQYGPKTGRFEDMKSWDDLYPAYKEQLKYFLTFGARNIRMTRLYRGQMAPQVFSSAFFDDCIKRGQDPTAGGCIYQGSAMYVIPTGIMDCVDSLAAIKKRVFEEGKISKKELLNALAANFEGYEDERRLLLSVPKYGNDDDYVDNIARDLYNLIVDVADHTDACYGAHWVIAPHTISSQGRTGRRCGALPSGRLAGVALAEGGVSPCQGADVKGPTATINSAGKIDQVPIYVPLFNMKFHPSALATKADLTKFLALIRTYFDDYGGKHIQFNVVSRETLIDAQAHPENYRNLIVRVAGYSAFFVELDRTLQDEVIGRMEKNWS
ncbi:MAG: pyruvate formate lyase family protein [Chloroflexota bacterium]